MIKVIKRNGSATDLDITKIRKVVQWACNGFHLNPMALEASLTTKLKDGVSTRAIQDNLIHSALELCSINEPDWRYVAGRLHMWNLWKEVTLSRGYDYGNSESFYRHIYTMIDDNLYDFFIVEKYSKEELMTAGSWLKPDRDSDYDYAGAVLFSKRYLIKNELPQEAYLMCALCLAQHEEDDGRKLVLAKAYYDAFSRRKISLATPLLANLRKPKGSLTSCFIVSMDDNLDSIFQELTNTAQISKAGGGVGVNVSRIRATGSKLMGKVNAAKGVIPWIKLLNDTMLAVDQAGSRTGAATVGLDIWHYDIPLFLEMQTENGDQRMKAYDVFPQVVIPDEFMRRLRFNLDWSLVCPYEVKKVLGIDLPSSWGNKFTSDYMQIEKAITEGKLTIVRTIKAKQLMKHIMQNQIETGLPYLAFKDTINKANPNQHDGYIPGTNLCVESYSNVKPGKLAHCCNLISLNLANVERDEIAYYSGLAVRLLDISIDITKPPIQDAKDHNNRYRTIGVGAMGLADCLAKNKLRYGSPEALEYVDNLFEDIAYFSTLASANLAGEKEPYEAFEGSTWSKGNLLGNRTLEEIKEDSYDPSRWEVLQQFIVKNGIRNSQITAIAPNTSSSLVHGCTASILPVFSRLFYDKAKNSVPIAPPFVNDYYWFYVENKTCDQTNVVNTTATIQKWIDTGISMEFLLNLNEGIYWADEPKRKLRVADIYNLILSAHEKGCKAIYYIRSVQQDNFEECVSCAN